MAIELIVWNAKSSKKKGCNKKLSAFTPRDLIEELAARGYRGKLTYTITKTILV